MFKYELTTCNSNPHSEIITRMYIFGYDHIIIIHVEI